MRSSRRSWRPTKRRFRRSRPNGRRAPPRRSGRRSRSAIAKSAAGATLSSEADRAILASGKLAKDKYTLVAATDLAGITGIRLEALTDPRLPQGGPGRAPNGNQVLSELRLCGCSDERSGEDSTGRSAKRAGRLQSARLGRLRRDRRQPGHRLGDWPARSGKNHVAVFECKERCRRGRRQLALLHARSAIRRREARAGQVPPLGHHLEAADPAGGIA